MWYWFIFQLTQAIIFVFMLVLWGFVIVLMLRIDSWYLVQTWFVQVEALSHSIYIVDRRACVSMRLEAMWGWRYPTHPTTWSTTHWLDLNVFYVYYNDDLIVLCLTFMRVSDNSPLCLIFMLIIYFWRVSSLIAK